MKKFLETLLLMVKLYWDACGRPTDVTHQSKYYTKLKEYNIRIFRGIKGIIFVVKDNKIAFKCYEDNFKLFYSTIRDAFIFTNWYLNTRKVYEITRNQCFSVKIFDGYIELSKIEGFPFILARTNNMKCIIYNYETEQVLFSSDYIIKWLRKTKIFVVKNDFENYFIIIPKGENGNWHIGEMNFLLTKEPDDDFYPQLVGNVVLLLKEKTAKVLQSFDSIEEVEWLPAPYEYLARKGEELYMVGISDDIYMINVDADDIMPLAEGFTGLENFFVLKNGNNVVIVKFEDDQLVRLGAVDGIGIKVGIPYFDFNESSIKIPLKVTVEKNLTE